MTIYHYVPYGTYSVDSPYPQFNGGKKRPEINVAFLSYQITSYIQRYKEATDLRAKIKTRFAREIEGWLVWYGGSQHISRYIVMQFEDYTPLERRIMIDILREIGYTRDHIGF